MRILIACDFFDYGGLETHVVTLAKELKRRGHHVVISALRDAGHYDDDLGRCGINVVECKDEVALQRLAETEKIEIIHAQPFVSIYQTYQAAKRTDIPFIITVHSMNDIYG